ncbi:MAG TPA: response regulator, partial [Isosphaeraceae bacterium]|nr:response regulator [Isosphaeraceae bacterium]
MSLHQLLIVHPIPSMRSLMTSMLRTMGHKIEEALGEEAVLAMLDQCRADLLLVSSDSADDLDPIHLLGQVRRKYPKLPVLMFTSEPRPDRAREVMLRGATSVLRFPMPANQFRAVVSQALEDVEPVRRVQEKPNHAFL